MGITRACWPIMEEKDRTASPVQRTMKADDVDVVSSLRADRKKGVRRAWRTGRRRREASLGETEGRGGTKGESESER
jgi:hypothetical protein